MLVAAALTPGQFILAWALAAAAAVGVFLHASKAGSRHATAWGIGVFLFLGLILPVYVVRALRRKRDGRRY